MTGKPPRLSAGVVVVRRDDDDYRFLLLRAYRNWDFPKGLVEAGEAPLAAAVREVEEETSLSGLAFPWGEAYAETAPYNRGKVARYYLAECRDAAVRLPVSAELGRPEHHEYRWMDYGEALARASPRLQPILHWAGRQLGLES
jgi:8-oxo-dGTP pyrophosphatase MutT (NUDIX family)